MRLAVLVALCGALWASSAHAAPQHITIDSIGVDADVVETTDVPSDPDTVGWYSLGPDVGMPGNAILLGHVDWAGKLRTFGLLHELSPGDVIGITDAQGGEISYIVDWLQLFDADTAPLDTIYAQTGEQQVTLITCGGVFNQSTHSYESRWVARATRQPEDDIIP
jgi:sortase (surface protein transpeptidase)